MILLGVLLKLTQWSSYTTDCLLFIFLIYCTFHPRFLDDLYFARSFERHGAFALLSSDVAGGRMATSTNLFCPSSAEVRNGKHRLQACLGLLAKTVGRCRRRRCKPLMTLCGTWERAAVLRCLVFSKRVDPCRGRRRSSVPTVVDDNDDDYDVLSSAITAQVAP